MQNVADIDRRTPLSLVVGVSSLDRVPREVDGNQSIIDLRDIPLLNVFPQNNQVVEVCVCVRAFFLCLSLSLYCTYSTYIHTYICTMLTFMYVQYVIPFHVLCVGVCLYVCVFTFRLWSNYLLLLRLSLSLFAAHS